MPDSKMLTWLMGLFAAAIVGIGAWSGASLNSMQAQMPLISFRLVAVEDQLRQLNSASIIKDQFTQAEGHKVEDSVRKLELRIVGMENRMDQSHPRRVVP